MATDHLKLTVPSATCCFLQGQETDMEKFLVEQHAATRMVPVLEPRDAMLGHDATIKGRYRLSATAFSQICYRLGRGMSIYLPDLAKSGPDGLSVAIEAYNRTVALRFKDRLDSQRFVVDESTGVIEGLVGSRYAHISNYDLFRRSRAFIATARLGVTFSEGMLTGRRFMMRFCSETPVFEIKREGEVAEPFFGGLHFSNSEVGNCAIRGTTVIVRQICANGAISSYSEGSKLVHVRNDKFELRFQKLLDTVNKKAKQYTVLKDGICRMMNTSLGLGRNKDSHRERIAVLVNKLNRQGLSKTVTKRILSRTLLCGSYDLRPLSLVSVAGVPTADYQRRTEFDLFNAITFEAKGLAVESRESAEHIGHKMVLGQLTFNEKR